MKLFFLIMLVKTVVPQHAMPRGVRREKVHLYSGEKFTCGSKTIDIYYVNDNYCDCEDGSDEPGTSACPHGRYYCRNRGYQDKEIPSSQVNDGVCDCCDGSDEFETGHCQNTCRELAKETEAEVRAEAQLHTEGSIIKAEWIKEAANIRKSWSEYLVAWEKEIKTLTPEWETLQAKKLHEEKLEKEENDRRDALRAAAEALANKSKSEELDTPTPDDAKPDDVKPDDTKPDDTKPDDTNPDDTKPAENFPYPEQYRFNEDKDTGTDDMNTNEDNSDDEIIQEEDEIVQEDSQSTGEKDGDTKLEENTENDTNEFSTYVSEAAKLAREKFDTIDNKKKNLEKKVSETNEKLQRDYGEQDEFLMLHDKCISVQHREYRYEICPYKKASQGSTSIGKWDKMDDSRQVMNFNKGTKCWNGPERSCNVFVKCGLENKLANVDEPSICVYTMTLHTPAACSQSHATALLMNLEMTDDELY